MSPEPPTPRWSRALEDLDQALEDKVPEQVDELVRALRDSLEAAFVGRTLAPGSVLIERKRRMHQRLDEIQAAAHDEDWAQARTVLDEVRGQLGSIIASASELPEHEPADAGWEPPAWLSNAGTVARKELVVALQGGQGLLLFALFLITFGIGLEAVAGGTQLGEGSVALVWNYAHSLDFLTVPLAGILLGHSIINEERTSRTIHFLASKPISRTGLVVGKWLGMAGALAVLIAVAAGIVGGVAYGMTRSLGDPVVVLGYVLATYLVALAFASLGLTASALLDRTGASLGAGIAAYLVLGPAWQNVFLGRQLEQGGTAPGMAEAVTYLASPFTSWWNLTSELLGPRSDVLGLPVGEPWHAALVEQVERGVREGLPFYATQPFYILVLLAWCVIGILAASWILSRRDLA